MGAASSAGKLLICGNSSSKKKRPALQPQKYLQSEDSDSEEESPAQSKAMKVSRRKPRTGGHKFKRPQVSEEDETLLLKRASNLRRNSLCLPDKSVKQLEKYQYFSKRQEKFYQLKFGEALDHQNLAVRQIQKRHINWKEVSVIGQGSFGVVVCGFDEKTGQKMAVKKMRLGGQAKNSEKIQDIQGEIQLLSNLDHPNIVTYLGSERQGDSLNIFLECVESGSLLDLIEKYGPLSEEVVRKYTQEILQGLEYLHYHNIVHRDIKSGNVLVGRQGVCKLADFGSAKIILEEEQLLNSLTGTTNWMAPEVIKQQDYGRYADIWSLGCTVYEMLVGSPPWSDITNMYEVMNIVVKGTKLPPIPKKLSQQATDFLNCCLKREPDQRSNVFELINHPFIKEKGRRRRKKKRKRKASEKIGSSKEQPLIKKPSNDDSAYTSSTIDRGFNRQQTMGQVFQGYLTELQSQKPKSKPNKSSRRGSGFKIKIPKAYNQMAALDLDLEEDGEEEATSFELFKDLSEKKGRPPRIRIQRPLTGVRPNREKLDFGGDSKKENDKEVESPGFRSSTPNSFQPSSDVLPSYIDLKPRKNNNPLKRPSTSNNLISCWQQGQGGSPSKPPRFHSEKVTMGSPIPHIRHDQASEDTSTSDQSLKRLGVEQVAGLTKHQSSNFIKLPLTHVQLAKQEQQTFRRRLSKKQISHFSIAQLPKSPKRKDTFSNKQSNSDSDSAAFTPLKNRANHVDQGYIVDPLGFEGHQTSVPILKARVGGQVKQFFPDDTFLDEKQAEDIKILKNRDQKGPNIEQRVIQRVDLLTSKERARSGRSQSNKELIKWPTKKKY